MLKFTDGLYESNASIYKLEEQARESRSSQRQALKAEEICKR
jgi:hypothetical protein